MLIVRNLLGCYVELTQIERSANPSATGLSDKVGQHPPLKNADVGNGSALLLMLDRVRRRRNAPAFLFRVNLLVVSVNEYCYRRGAMPQLLVC